MIKIAKHKMPLCLMVAYFERTNIPQLLEQNEIRKNRFFLFFMATILILVFFLRARLF